MVPARTEPEARVPAFPSEARSLLTLLPADIDLTLSEAESTGLGGR
jgi:hypothetical protein